VAVGHRGNKIERRNFHLGARIVPTAFVKSEVPLFVRVFPGDLSSFDCLGRAGAIVILAQIQAVNDREFPNPSICVMENVVADRCPNWSRLTRAVQEMQRATRLADWDLCCLLGKINTRLWFPARQLHNPAHIEPHATEPPQALRQRCKILFIPLFMEPGVGQERILVQRDVNLAFRWKRRRIPDSRSAVTARGCQIL
jgi:hypothetical protein